MTTVRLTAAIALAMCVVPAIAHADRHHFVLHRGHVTRFRLQGSAGYRIRIAENARGYFTLRARRPGASTEYITRGRGAGEYGVRATLPGFGAVSVAFTPNGRKHQLRPYSNCDGPGPVIRMGVVRGRVRFAADRGFTRVTAHRVRAEAESWQRQRCRFQRYRPRKRPHRETAVFSARSRGAAFTGFRATRFSPRFRPLSRQVDFSADTISHRGPVTIYRSVSVVGSSSTFQQPEAKTAPEHLVVSPPPPFSGTASFQRTSESTFTWEGSLDVVFPGTEPVALSGPGFGATFCVLTGCIRQSALDSREFRG